jgi:dipeptidyl aminopeptidase/acylaminoacyl peptidase
MRVSALFATAALVAGTFSPSEAQQRAIADPAAAFGTRPSVEDISLSPDGTKVAYLSPRPGQGSAVYVASLSGGDPRGIASVDGNPQRLMGCDWVANDRLACKILASVNALGALPVTRMIALDSDGSDMKVLTQQDDIDQRYGNTYGGNLIDLLPGEDGAVLMDRWFVPEIARKTRLAQEKEGFGVVRVDTRSLSTKTVEEPIRFGADFISDGRGRVRIMGKVLPKNTNGYMGRTINYYYRTADSDRWHTLGDYDMLSRDGVNPLAIDSKLNALYALKKENGRQVLYRISLDGSLRQERIFAHPQVDVDGVIRIGRSRRPVAAAFVTEKREAIYFDPELNRLAQSLAKSMPKLPQIRFVDSSVDESKLLILAASDTDPGHYFVFDKASKQLSEIMLVRPKLEGAALAEVTPVSYKAADGTTIPAYLTLPPGGAKTGLPAIVMPHGGPSSRDEWGFDWLVQFYAARGYAVLQPNFRGSEGYGDAFFEKNGFQSWRTAIGDVNDAGRWLISQGVADPKKLAIVGWSYGGYAALQSAVLDPSLYKAVIAIAPVTDLALLKEESSSLGREFVGSGPHVREGSPAQNAERFTAPVLMFHGDLDSNVDVRESKLMEDKLRSAGKRVQLVIYPKRDHSLDDSQVRIDMLRKSDAFLRTSMGL